MSDGKLSLKVKMGYGVYDLGGNLFFTVNAFVLLNFLTDNVKLSAGLAGTVLMIGRIWDAFYDPIIGYMSDRTTTRWGRRRPFMFIGAAPLFIAMWLMFTNPSVFAGAGFDPLQSQNTLFVWALVMYTLLCTAYSTLNIPYSSLTPELTQDFHERTSLNGFRFGFAVIGTLMGAGAALPLVGLMPDKIGGYSFMGFVFGAVMLITAMVTVFSVRESTGLKPPPSGGFLKTYLSVFRNKPFVFILVAYALNITAITIVSGSAIYFFKYLHHNEGQTTIAMLILLLTAMLFIPVSVVTAKKTGKKFVYGAGMLFFSICITILFALGHTLPVWFSFMMMFFAGIGMGFTYAMPYAIVPDAIEYDYLLTGERKEGAFYGIWTFTLKVGQALAALLTGWLLSVSGFVPDVEQGGDALFAIRLLIGPLPAIVFVLSCLVLYFYPINEKRYAEIVEEIKKMEAGKA